MLNLHNHKLLLLCCESWNVAVRRDRRHTKQAYVSSGKFQNITEKLDITEVNHWMKFYKTSQFLKDSVMQ